MNAWKSRVYGLVERVLGTDPRKPKDDKRPKGNDR